MYFDIKVKKIDFCNFSLLCHVCFLTNDLVLIQIYVIHRRYEEPLLVTVLYILKMHAVLKASSFFIWRHSCNQLLWKLRNGELKGGTLKSGWCIANCLQTCKSASGGLFNISGSLLEVWTKNPFYGIYLWTSVAKFSGIFVLPLFVVWVWHISSYFVYTMYVRSIAGFP